MALLVRENDWRRLRLLFQFLSDNAYSISFSLLTFVAGVWIGGLRTGGLDLDNSAVLEGNGPLIRQRALFGGPTLPDPKSVEIKQATALVSNMQQQQQLQQMQQEQQQQQHRELDVHVRNMCRCGAGKLAHLDLTAPSAPSFDTRIVQPPCLATGIGHSKHYHMHSSKCDCIAGKGTSSPDKYMWKLPRTRCNSKNPTDYNWWNMPDFGVEELPLFMGSLSFESPLPLNASLHNYLDFDLHRRLNLAGHFIQLNHRSPVDDEVVTMYNRNLEAINVPPAIAMGNPEENLHPGLAIARQCRAAELHPRGHPNGENLLLFLEKDWSFVDPVLGFDNRPGGFNNRPGRLEDIFRSINALTQRGVPYVRLGTKRCGKKGCPRTRKCTSMGVEWDCTESHEQRWSNQPFVADCRWFLRYFEPFALLGASDGIMMGCRDDMQEGRYCDWEEAAQDGRIAWVEAQWTMALFPDEICDLNGDCAPTSLFVKHMFFHHEEGGK